MAILEVCKVNADDIVFSFHRPKIIPKNNTPATTCTINTIGATCSKQLIRIPLDLGSTCCLIKQYCLPQGVTLRDPETKTVKTLAGQLVARRIITLCNIRLPDALLNKKHVSSIMTPVGTT
jgi:hypothetical protein